MTNNIQQTNNNYYNVNNVKQSPGSRRMTIHAGSLSGSDDTGDSTKLEKNLNQGEKDKYKYKKRKTQDP